MMTWMPKQQSLSSLFLSGAEEGDGGRMEQQGGLSAFFQVCANWTLVFCIKPFNKRLLGMKPEYPRLPSTIW